MDEQKTPERDMTVYATFVVDGKPRDIPVGKVKVTERMTPPKDGEGTVTLLDS